MENQQNKQTGQQPAKQVQQTQQPTQENQQQTSASQQENNEGIITPPPINNLESSSIDKKGSITILLLTFLPPIGTIFMWYWMRKWPLWLKISISAPLALIIIAVVLITVFIGSFPHPQT